MVQTRWPTSPHVTPIIHELLKCVKKIAHFRLIRQFVCDSTRKSFHIRYFYCDYYTVEISMLINMSNMSAVLTQRTCITVNTSYQHMRWVYTKYRRCSKYFGDTVVGEVFLQRLALDSTLFHRRLVYVTWLVVVPPKISTNDSAYLCSTKQYKKIR